MNQNLPVQRANSFVSGSPPQGSRAFSVNEMGPREFLSAIFKHKVMILVSFVLIACLSGASMFFYLKFMHNPVYQAKSVVLVQFGWENQNIDLSPGRRQSGMSSQELLATEIRILQSRDLKEKIIREMKPEVIFPDLERNIPMGLAPAERALYRFEKDFSVKNSGPNIIEVSLSGPDPRATATAVNNLVDSYIDKRGDTYRNPKALQFLDQKTEEYRQKLADAESRLKAFQDQSQIISFDEQRTFLLNKQRQLADSRHDNEIQITQLQQKTSELERQLPSIQKTSIDATVKMSELENRLLGLELQEKELLSKYKEDNRFVSNVREQIALTRNYINARGPGSKLAPFDPAYQDLQKQILQNKAEVSSLKVKQKGLDEQITAVNAELGAFESQESKYKQMSRDVADNDEKYKTYLSKLEEARIHDELDRQKMTSVSVLEPAAIPIIPMNLPQTLVFYVVGTLFLAIAGSIGLVLILEIMNPGMSTPAQAEKRLELPVLAVVACK
jgi:uncharacterized protein involved in exopolysaccharide biosynthesis